VLFLLLKIENKLKKQEEVKKKIKKKLIDSPLKQKKTREELEMLQNTF
jgi:hypothetical protein